MLLQTGRIRLHLLPGLAALVFCLAIVLNFVPLKASKREPVRATAEQSTWSATIDRLPESGIEQLHAAEPAGEGTDEGQVFQRLLQLSSVPSVTLASTAVPAGATAGSENDRPASEPAAQADDAIAGVWAPDGSACSLRDFREGTLPTVINMNGAWAGETFCVFKNRKRIEAGWRVVASCFNPREHWTTGVRLTTRDHRLTWTSKRGEQIYTQCSSDFLRTAAR